MATCLKQILQTWTLAIVCILATCQTYILMNFTVARQNGNLSGLHRQNWTLDVYWQPVRTRSVTYTCIDTRKNDNLSQTDPSDLDARYSLYWQPVRPTSL